MPRYKVTTVSTAERSRAEEDPNYAPVEETFKIFEDERPEATVRAIFETGKRYGLWPADGELVLVDDGTS